MSCCAGSLALCFGRWVVKITSELIALENIAIPEKEKNNLSDPINEGYYNQCLTEVIPDGFFGYMKTLTVLDLSKSGLRVLPTEISDFVSLQYLDISNTEIETLPEGIMNLQKLQCFILEFTTKLKEVPRGMIASLKLLQVFRVVGSRFVLSTFSVEELESLESLQILSITIRDANIYHHVLNSHKLSRCIQSLLVEDLDPAYGELVGTKTKTAYGISTTRCFDSLGEVKIHFCHYLEDLTWVTQAPNLMKLSVRYCENLQRIISDGGVEEDDLHPFMRLQQLELIGLPQLKFICLKPMVFLFLDEIRVCGCPMLKKLPLNANSAKGGCQLVIEGTTDWWIQLQWEDDATRSAFKLCFQSNAWFSRTDGTDTFADRDRCIGHRLHSLYAKLDRWEENWRKIMELVSNYKLSEEEVVKFRALVKRRTGKSQLQEA